MSATFTGYAAREAGGKLAPFSYEPRPLQPDDVEIAISHGGVCHSDLHSIDNDWGNGKYPMIAGHEIIGTVVAKGDKVRGLELGSVVGVGPTCGSCWKCDKCASGNEQMCKKAVSTYNHVDYTGHRTYGGFADRIRVDHRWAFAIPQNLPLDTAAPLLCAGITVYSPLKRWTKPGMRVGVLGIGGLGHLGLQFARNMGCHVVALSSSANKRDEALSHGANDFVVTKDRKAMRAWRGKLDFILVTVNVELNWSHYLSLLQTDGRLCFVGIPPKIVLNPGQLVMKRLSVSGSPTGSGGEVREMLQVAADTGVRAQVERFDIEDVNAAFARVKANQARYRCVLLISDEAKRNGGPRAKL